MARFDSRLVAPSAGQLVAALLSASAAANQELAILSVSLEQWEDFIPQIRILREGLRQWSDTRAGDTARVAVAWWTDHVGRRHVRVTAGNSRDGSYRSLTAARTDQRPPLWHVYPERLYFRHAGMHRDWLAVCGCGMAGDPATLGWMGLRCGPCHDRQQEGEPVPSVFPITAIGHAPQEGDFLFWSNEKSLLAIHHETDWCVRLHDLQTGEVEDLFHVRQQPSVLALWRDRLIALGFEDGELLLFDREAEEVVLEQREIAFRHLAFAPSGRMLALGGSGGLRIWEQHGADWRLGSAHDRPVTCLNFSADGQLLAVGAEWRLTALDPYTGEFLPGPDPEIPHMGVVIAVGFRQDGQLVCVAGHRLPGLDTGEELRIFEPQETGLQPRASHDIPALYRASLSPDGNWLAWIARDGGTVFVVNVSDGIEVGQLGWDPDRRLVSLCFSPDGELLAVQDNSDTIKLIPWRVLLGT